jgi:hypothetical protein
LIDRQIPVPNWAWQSVSSEQVNEVSEKHPCAEPSWRQNSQRPDSHAGAQTPNTQVPESDAQVHEPPQPLGIPHNPTLQNGTHGSGGVVGTGWSGPL